MSAEQRKKRFVDPVVQGALCRRMILHWLLFLVVTSGCACLLQVFANPFQPWATHFSRMWRVQGPYVLVGLCLIPVFVADTIKLSHRFAGPLTRIRNDMRRVGQGERVPLVKLRPNDYWQEFAREFNTMLTRLYDSEERARTNADRSQDASSTDDVQEASVC